MATKAALRASMPGGVSTTGARGGLCVGPGRMGGFVLGAVTSRRRRDRIRALVRGSMCDCCMDVGFVFCSGFGRRARAMCGVLVCDITYQLVSLGLICHDAQDSSDTSQLGNSLQNMYALQALSHACFSGPWLLDAHTSVDQRDTHWLRYSCLRDLVISIPCAPVLHVEDNLFSLFDMLTRTHVGMSGLSSCLLVGQVVCSETHASTHIHYCTSGSFLSWSLCLYTTAQEAHACRGYRALPEVCIFS